MTLRMVEIAPISLERFQPLLDEPQRRELRRDLNVGRELLLHRTVWNVNSTARGGGVAELLRSLVAYALGARFDTRWAVIGGDADFFTITKRLHNHLHGERGDGKLLGEDERRHYQKVLDANLVDLTAAVRPGDIVILHDPQTAGMAPALHTLSTPTVWRCHVGLDVPNRLARAACDFLTPYVREADRMVFSSEAFQWDGVDRSRMVVIPPRIDAFSPKNIDLSAEQVRGILAAVGISREQAGNATCPRLGGSHLTVRRQATLIEESKLGPEHRLVLQISRWDRLKDPAGVLQGFVHHVAPHTDDDVHLVLAGPDVEAVADDPEGRHVLEQVRGSWESLSSRERGRIHLIELPMDDIEENAAIVNALQRRAEVIVQKSLAEGFGLTVSEAMWKAKPVVASAIGGIRDQIENDVSGVLLDDPRDLQAFGTAVTRLLEDAEFARKLGRAARERVRRLFLDVDTLMEYERLFEGMLADRG
jgi:trehalose synthase